jgi:aryl-alcohol dehydrogenase-like predicted oxidoreductase
VLWTSDANGYEPFRVSQPKFNAVHRDSAPGMLDVAADQNLAVCPYEPLEGGFLTGKYSGDGAPEGSRGDLNDWSDDRFDDRQWRVLDRVLEVAEEIDATPAQVSVRWLMDQRRFTCVPIIGSRTPEQLRENVGATDISLTDAQRERITHAY